MFGIIVGQHIGTDLQCAMLGPWLFGQPPPVRHHNNFGMHLVTQAHSGAQAASNGFHPGKLAGLDAQVPRGVTMHFNHGLRRKLAQ